MSFVISLIGQKGGTTKTTTARLLAVELARTGKSVAIIDADPGQHSITDWVAARKLNNRQPPLESTIIDIEDEPDLRLGSFAKYDFVIIDAPGYSDRQTVDIALLSDLSILTMGTASDDRRPTLTLFNDLEAAGVEESRVLVAFTKVLSEAKLRKVTAQLAESERTPFPYHLEMNATYEDAGDVGRALSEVSHAGLAKKAGDFAKALINHIETMKPRQSGSAPAKRFVAGKW